MVRLEDFQPDRETAWCPGCGNFPLREEKPTFRDRLEHLPSQPLVEKSVRPEDMKFLLEDFRA